jgi:endonuclease-3
LKKLEIKVIYEKLEKLYPNTKCMLNYNEPWQLLLATRLSAQCTDKRVNVVTAELFEKYPTIKSLANSELADVEKIVKPCGLFHTKASNLIEICKNLEKYKNIPENMDELLKLPGIGRKTANLIMGEIYKKPCVVCDTHMLRITARLGLTGNDCIPENQAEIAEKKLQEKLIQANLYQNGLEFSHRIVTFGREICKARKPLCGECVLSEDCLKHKTIN